MFVRNLHAALLGAVMVFFTVISGPVTAAPYAAMVMDARNGEVLHSRNADTRLHPASLTKMMTLYIAFEALRLGEITLDTEVRISANAANEPPSRLGLRAGSTIRLRYLIRAAAVRSGNDAATAIGEAISGSEAAFARRMTRTARALGMTRTTFRNAHGLTEEGHLSTARDMSMLGRRLIYDYPQYYNLFSRVTADAGIATVRNTNRVVLTTYRGADGIKTGYTRAAGFNLVASAQRGEERIIATVFGGRSSAWRNDRVMELLDMGFERAPSSVALRTPPLPTYANDGGPSGTSSTPRGQRAPQRSLRPMVRPGGGVDATVIAAISDAVGAALDPNMLAEPEGSAEVAAAVDAALSTRSVPMERPSPRPEPQAVVEPEPAPIPPPEPELVTRASSTGSRLYGVSLGLQTSQHAAERLLLRTALAELGTFDTALRQVVNETRGFDARFAGMTEEQASNACARLSARDMACETFGP
ncbi:D-alanyl-D-alanine carboxypeptidase family protein [Gymnodinialimonas ceratoperidinii]|uniref:D-alanyl-D-alanine carboxypeptidase n=1 Tax=Gymnodinialimonas ceratoperidinii TaxID=2856823 RepID=A0A8F6TWT3_9RHOB|nr:D-alanyl-D-alanine carboxypeptidase family protein [Gymnodinialimonas ceratoperidinii]QXT40391.1 D-alanyl-D-alanine carboxypeptidase [Gymnodinialimonas ceratoperidinii]